MAHHRSVIPEPGTYGRVMLRRDYDPRSAHQQIYTAYDVSLRAVAAELGGEVCTMIFFPIGKDAAAHRASRLNWIDCTAAWMKQLDTGGQGAHRATLDAMVWNDFRKLATEAGLPHGGKREALTDSLVEIEYASRQAEKAA